MASWTAGAPSSVRRKDRRALQDEPVEPGEPRLEVRGVGRRVAPEAGWSPRTTSRARALQSGFAGARRTAGANPPETQRQASPADACGRHLSPRRRSAATHPFLLQLLLQLLPAQQLPVAAARARSAPRGCPAPRSRPSSSTRIQSASRTAARRWETMMLVRPSSAPRSAAQDLRLGLRVHRAQRVVQHEDRRVLRQRARDGGALLLPAGEIDPPLAQHGVVARRAGPAAPR